MSFFPGKGAYISRKSGYKRRVIWRREDQVVDPDCLSCINQRRIEAEARANPSPEEMDDEMARAASPESDPCRIIIRLNDDDDDDGDNDGDNAGDNAGDNEVAMDENDYGNGAGNGNGHHYDNGNGAGNGNHSNGNGGDGGNARGRASGSVGGSGSSADDSARGSSVSRQSGSGRSDPEPEPVAGPSSASASLVNYGASTSGLAPSSFDDEEEGKRPKKKVCAKPMDLDYYDDDDFDEDSDPNNNRLQHIPTPLRPYEGYYFTADEPTGITRDDWNAAGPSGVNTGASTSKGASGQCQTSDSSLSSSCSHHSLVDRYTHMNISGCEDQTDEECAFSESGDDADDLDDD